MSRYVLKVFTRDGIVVTHGPYDSPDTARQLGEEFAANSSTEAWRVDGVDGPERGRCVASGWRLTEAD